MKKSFSFEETVTYVHQIDVEVDEQRLDEFERFADEMAENVDAVGVESDKRGIVNRFAQKFGADNVTFIEDGSPAVEYSVF